MTMTRRVCGCGEPAKWRLLVRCEDIFDNYWEDFCSLCAIGVESTEIEEIEDDSTVADHEV